MASSTNAWKLGLFVVVGWVLLVGGAIWLGARYFRPDVLIITTYFDESVQGLTLGAPVKIRGVPIGVVKDIDLAPNMRLVRVDCEVDALKLIAMGIDVDASREQRCILCGPDVRLQVVAAGITGSKLIQVNFFDPMKYPPLELDFKPPWNYLPSVPSTLQNIETGINRMVDTMPTLLEDAVSSLERINMILVELDIPRIMTEVEGLLGDARAKMAAFDAAGLTTKINAFVDEGETTLARVRQLTSGLEADDIKTLVTRAYKLMEEAKGALEEAQVGETSESLRSTATVISSEVASLGDEFRSELQTLRATLESVQALASLLERDPGALIRGKGGDE